ncbi:MULTISPECIES: acyl carrier protein [unclassified Kitasatospora]|uniref:acyl carrier protein n=1 Tax=Kitasatospora TaxID=2063 RepID=UPI000C2B8A52
MTNPVAPTAPADPAAPAQIRSEVARFLSRYVDDPASLEAEHLLTGGLLDSLAAVELIGHLERRFGVRVLDHDLEVDNFDSLAAITAFVARKQRA